jgi:ABC-type multidrug transport system fused ATPase/permease subunit
MQNNQSFLEWAWNNHPWMLFVMGAAWLTMIAFLNWLISQAKKAPVRPVPRITIVMSPLGLAVGSFSGWFFWPNDLQSVVRICICGFVGLMLGTALSTLMPTLPEGE